MNIGEKRTAIAVEYKLRNAQLTIIRVNNTIQVNQLHTTVSRNTQLQVTVVKMHKENTVIVSTRQMNFEALAMDYAAC